MTELPTGEGRDMVGFRDAPERAELTTKKCEIHSREMRYSSESVYSFIFEKITN